MQYIYLLLCILSRVDGNWQFFAQLEIIPSRKTILIRRTVGPNTPTIYFPFFDSILVFDTRPASRRTKNEEKKACLSACGTISLLHRKIRKLWHRQSVNINKSVEWVDGKQRRIKKRYDTFHIEVARHKIMDGFYAVGGKTSCSSEFNFKCFSWTQ